MNILPKNYSEFREKEYWDNFFKAQHNKKQHFEWYGNFQDYKSPIFLALSQLYNLNNKPKGFKVANVGCGNSTFGEDLVKGYPIFDLHVWNSDYSEQVIAQMENRRKQLKLGDKISYEVCDMLAPLLNTLTSQFDVVIDKGTLDAILPQDLLKLTKQIKTVYFRNIKQLLNLNKHSSYLIISMLQQFVLRTLLEHFLDDPHCQVSIHENCIANSQIQPFLVNVRHNPQPSPLREVNIVLLNKTTIKCATIEDTLAKIKDLQQLDSFTKGIRALRQGQITKFNIFDQNKTIRYMIDIADHSDAKVSAKNTCAVFIVPQGLENTPTFTSQNGIRSLLDQIGSSRLIIVKLAIGQTFSDMQQIKSELNNIMPKIIQKDCKPTAVPYLTDGSIGQRHYLFQNNALFIEEVLIQGEAFRRMILRDNLSVVQSQFKLTYVSEKNHPALKETQSQTLPHKKGLVVAIDLQYLDYGYCRVIVTALIDILEKELNKSRILHLGGGGCTIAKFLHHSFEGVSQTIVQVNRNVINSGKYFEWPEKDHRFDVIQADAYAYVTTTKQTDKFDAIVVDITGNDKQEFCPPHQFSSEQFLHAAVSQLAEGGLIIFNTLILRQQKTQKEPNYIELLYAIKEISMVYSSINREGNTVIVAVKQTPTVKEGPLGSEATVLVSDRTKLTHKFKFQWQEDSLKSLSLARPIIGQKYKQSQMLVEHESPQNKPQKKKKKK